MGQGQSTYPTLHSIVINSLQYSDNYIYNITYYSKEAINSLFFKKTVF